MTQRLSAQGLVFIATFEDFRGTAYQDDGGVWTIGFGHTGGVRKGDKITVVDALEVFYEDIQVAEKAVRQLVTVSINQNRFDALVSFVFNIGAGAFSRSSLLRRLNAGSYGAVPEELARWDKVDGKPLAGLTRRRQAEAGLWAEAA